jgi:hypothetical protein
MRRPLENYITESEQSKNLHRFLEQVTFPRAIDRLAYKAYMAFHSAVFGPAKSNMFHSTNSYVHFDGKESLFDRLGLKEVAGQLQSGKLLCIPENPETDKGQVADRYFPQLAVIWEGQKNGYKFSRTLEIEIGSRFNLLSLTICPLISNKRSEALQLDLLNVMRAHDYYSLDVEDAKNQPVIGSILSNVQLMVEQFVAGKVGGQVEIDRILNDIVDTVISHQPPKSDQDNDDQDYDDTGYPSLEP